MGDFNPAEVLKGTVADITGKFGSLSNEQLAQLHDAEKGGQKRTTLLDEIHREQKTREAGAGGAGDAATDSAGAATGTGGSDQSGSTGGEGGADDQAEPSTYTQSQVDAMLASQALSHQAERDRAVAAAVEGAKAPPPVIVAQDKPLVIDTTADNVSLVALSGMSFVQFVDDRDVPIPGLTPTPFQPADFEPMGGAVTLKREIDFPRELPRTEISGAFLLDDEDEPVGKATLVQPFAIGGGRAAKMLPSTLQFSA